MVERLHRGILEANPTIDQLHDALGQLGYTGSVQDRVAAWGAAQGYTGSISDISRSAETAPAAPAALQLATGLPTPVRWYTAREVTMTGDDIDTFVDQGSDGIDATFRNASYKATLTTMGGQTAALMSTDGLVNGGYTYTSANVKTVMMRLTYGDGTDTTFTDFDSMLESGTARFVGNTGTATTYSSQPANAIVDGAAVGNSPTVLPMNNRTVGLVSTTTLTSTVFGNNSNSFPTRVWRGSVGDIMMWAEELTAQQISDQHAEFEAFYNA